MNTHIDQLAQWYADAEQITKTNLPRIGDALIFPYSAEGYAIEVEEDEWTPNIVMPGEQVRILSRAPKPKPAWHDAPAVIAETTLHYRRVWVREGDGTYSNTEGELVDDYELHDVTPLIEAEVTGAMIDRILDVIAARFDNYPAGIGEELAVAALGLEAE